MEQYKQEFIEFMVDCQALKFGEFTLKSGRKSPFFMNAGAYVTGSQLMKLGESYAKAIHDTYGDDFDVLFGPAYKGIPISVVTAVAYSKLYGKEVRYCSDRKEEKDHGADKGSFLGSPLKDGDRVIMIEDVTTSGKSMEETVPKVRGAANVEIVGLMVSLNRMEKGLGVKVWVDDRLVYNNLLLSAAVGICKFNGGGIQQLPEAVADDGMLDLSLIRPVHFWHLLFRFHYLFNGGIYRIRHILQERGSRIRIESSPEVSVEIDGEPLGHTPLEFSVLHQAVRIVVGREFYERATLGETCG